MRMPPRVDFAAMCVELVPLPEPKDIVVERPRKAISISREARARQAESANETKRRAKRDKEAEIARARQAAGVRAARLVKRKRDPEKY